MDIQHDIGQQKFFVVVDGQTAELNYQKLPNGNLDYIRTFTPPDLRGKGLAGQLTKVALEYARSQGLKVTPTCPYIATYIKRHPEYQKLVP